MKLNLPYAQLKVKSDPYVIRTHAGMCLLHCLSYSRKMSDNRKQRVQQLTLLQLQLLRLQPHLRRRIGNASSTSSW